MNYTLLKDLIQLTENFEMQNQKQYYSADLDGFKQWLYDGMKDNGAPEPDWEGKENGRSAESVINTLIVHMNRYAKTYSRSAIHGSAFSTQEEFIYLINLRAFGPMGKMELIKKNVQDKPVGMQIVNRLLQEGWVTQRDSQTDKRSKIIRITQKGLRTLERQMDKIRQATRVVTGDLTHHEKMQLIELLDKLDRFHRPIFSRNMESADLLEEVISSYLPA